MADRHIQQPVRDTYAQPLDRVRIALEAQIAAGGGAAILELDGGAASASGTPSISIEGGSA